MSIIIAPTARYVRITKKKSWCIFLHRHYSIHCAMHQYHWQQNSPTALCCHHHPWLLVFSPLFLQTYLLLLWSNSSSFVLSDPLACPCGQMKILDKFEGADFGVGTTFLVGTLSVHGTVGLGGSWVVHLNQFPLIWQSGSSSRPWENVETDFLISVGVCYLSLYVYFWLCARKSKIHFKFQIIRLWRGISKVYAVP